MKTEFSHKSWKKLKNNLFDAASKKYSSCTLYTSYLIPQSTNKTDAHINISVKTLASISNAPMSHMIYKMNVDKAFCSLVQINMI